MVNIRRARIKLQEKSNNLSPRDYFYRRSENMPIIVSHVNVAWQRLFILLLFIIEGAFKKSDLAPDRSF